MYKHESQFDTGQFLTSFFTVLLIMVFSVQAFSETSSNNKKKTCPNISDEASCKAFQRDSKKTVKAGEKAKEAIDEGKAGTSTIEAGAESFEDQIKENIEIAKFMEKRAEEVCNGNYSEEECERVKAENKKAVKALLAQNRSLKKKIGELDRAADQTKHKFETESRPAIADSTAEPGDTLGDRDIKRVVDKEAQEDVTRSIVQGDVPSEQQEDISATKTSEESTPPPPEPNPQRVERTVEMAQKIKQETDRLANSYGVDNRDAIIENSSRISEMRREVVREATQGLSGDELKAARADAIKNLDIRTAQKFSQETGLSYQESKKFIGDYDNKIYEIENEEVTKRMAKFDQANPNASERDVRIRMQEIQLDVESESAVARSYEVQNSLERNDPEYSGRIAQEGLGTSDQVRQAGISAGRQALLDRNFPASEVNALTSEAQLNNYAFERGEEKLRDYVSSETVRGTREASQAANEKWQVATSPYNKTSLREEVRNRFGHGNGNVVTNPRDPRHPGHSPHRPIGAINDRVKDSLGLGNKPPQNRNNRNSQPGDLANNRNGRNSNERANSPGSKGRGSSPFDQRVRDFSARDGKNGSSGNRIRSSAENSTVGRLQSQLDSLIERSEALRESQQGNRFNSIVGAVASVALKGGQGILSMFQPEEEKSKSNPGVLSREEQLKVVAQEVYKGGQSQEEKKEKSKDKEKKRKKVDLDWLGEEEEKNVSEFDRSIANAAEKKGIDVDHLRPTRKQLEQKYSGPTEGYQERLTFTSASGRSNWEKIRLRHENISTIMKK